MSSIRFDAAGLFSPSVLGRGTVIAPTRASTRSPSALSSMRSFALRELGADLQALRRSLSKLGAAAGTGGVRAARARGAVARSSEALALEVPGTFTTLRSTQEVNTITTSFTPFGPDVTGATTSLPTLGGVYDGDQGDTTLTFRFRDDATVGSSDRNRVEMLDEDLNRIQQRNYRNLAPGTFRTYSNGLELALGPGVVEQGDTFVVQVSTSVGSAVDPDRPLDGIRNENPNLEPGLDVIPGSFEVNGTAVSVLAGDSLNDVLARITASAAGVDASFDADSETVVLTQRSSGSAPDITLANDTSGLLAATKLATATAVPGLDGSAGASDPIDQVPALSSIGSGDFRVNGVAISIDVSSDSLGDVLARINASAAGVRARFDAQSGRVEISGDDPGRLLRLEAGTSGFLAGVRIAPGNYAARGRAAARPAFDDPDRVRKELRAFATALNRVFSASDAFGVRGGATSGLRSALSKTFTAFVGEPSGAYHRSKLGIDLDFGAGSDGALRIDRRRFDNAVDRSPDQLRAFLLREDSDADGAGLIAAIEAVAEGLQRGVNARLGLPEGTARYLDLRA